MKSIAHMWLLHNVPNVMLLSDIKSDYIGFQISLRFAFKVACDIYQQPTPSIGLTTHNCIVFKALVP